MVDWMVGKMAYSKAVLMADKMVGLMAALSDEEMVGWLAYKKVVILVD